MTNLSMDELEILIQHADTLNHKSLQELIEHFPFDSLINITILNYEFLRLHVILLEKIIKNDVFYKSPKSIEYVRHILNFILTNITLLKDIHSNEILSWLLNLLTTIIQKAKDFEKVTKFLQNKKEKLFETVSMCSKFSFFNISHVNDFKSVMYEILMFDGFLHDGHSKTFMEMVNIFMDFKAHYEISIWTEIVIEKYHISSEIFSVFSTWLLKNGITFLVESNEELLLAKLLKIINCLYTKYERSDTCKDNKKNAIECSINFLTQNVEFLVSFFSKPNLRKDSAKLFAFVLAAQNLENSWDYFYKKIVNLPVDPSEWVRSEPELFLRICNLLCENNRYSLKPSLLKIMCYMYPLLMAECITKRNAILGDDLMIIISRQHYKLETIFSLHLSQLNWILRKGENFLKKLMICFWLNHNGDLEILKKCILSANMQKLLISIIIDVNTDFPISLKAAELIKNIDDPNFKTTIAKMLPVFSDNPKVFNRLMISNPGIPDDKDLALRMAEFMSLIQFFTMDELIFGLICDYSKRLVIYLKEDKRVLTVFCKNSKNIVILVKRLKKLKTELALNNAMGLIKVLLLVQKRNHISIEDSIEIDFAYILKGSSIKVEKCLDVLFLLTTQRLFIKLTPESIFSIFVRLFSLCNNPDLTVKSLICLTEMLKANKWLATSSITNFFVENHCSLAVDDKSCHEFVVFLGVWIKILKNCLEADKKFYLAHTGIIRNYIKRVDGLPQSRVNYLLKSLNRINRISFSSGFHLL